MKQLDTDYLVIGTGAVSMAFVDTMLEESDARFTMVDRHHMPGGHWNDAYPFVRLHQPSAFYGVASTELGANRIDASGPNKGLYELASGTEVLAYFDRVMRERFLPSGRVDYYPLCEVRDSNTFASLISGDAYRVTHRKLVDGTLYNTSVPSTHRRSFAVDDGVACIPPNELPRRAPDYQRFAILGGGKTSMDTLVWLLSAGAAPEALRWVCPRDSWLTNRDTTQPGARFFASTVGAFANQLEAMVAADSVEDLWRRLEACEVMLRVDPNVQPTMYHFATISKGELAQLRRVKDVVRGRRVRRLTPDAIHMTEGAPVPAAAETLYIDCTARAVPFDLDNTQPVFEGDRINLQPLRAPLVATSAAMVAFVEAHFDDDVRKNELCAPVGLSDDLAQWPAVFMANMLSMNTWSQDPKLRKWFAACRLNPARPMPGDEASDIATRRPIMERIKQNSLPALMNLQKLLPAPAKE